MVYFMKNSEKKVAKNNYFVTHFRQKPLQLRS
jgi:hypothetical protein